MAEAREANLLKVLEKIAKERNYDNAEFQIKVLPPTGANFTAQLFHITITAPGQKDLKLFAKVAAVGETMRNQTLTNIYDIELHVYTKLAKSYAEIEEKHNVPKEHRLVLPEYFGSNETYLEEVLVLKDLSADGFITYDRFESVDWPYASKAVEELAKFHALSIAFQKEYPDSYQEALKVLKRAMPATGSEMMAALQDMIMKAVATVPEGNRAKLMKFIMANMDPEKMIRFYQPQQLPVIIHSDFRQSNLMHKINENGSVQLVIVDYQTAHAGSATTDLLYFIFTSSDGKFRKDHYSRLIDHYYEHMTEALKRLHLDPNEVFPREVFDQELKNNLHFGLLVASMMLPLIMVDAAQLPASGDNDCMESLMQMMAKSCELCGKRLNEVVDDYVAWGLL